MAINDKVLLNQRSDFVNGVELEELKLDMSDDELKGLIKNWLSISAQSETVLKTNGDINKNYYIGKDLKTNEILNDKSKVVDNRIFTDLETVIPLVTSTPAKPTVFIPSSQGKGEQGKKIRDQRIKTQKILLGVYGEQKLQSKFEKLVRQHQIYRIGMVKYGICDGKIFTNIVLPPRLLLDSEATCDEDSEFIGEKIVKTAKELIKKYPDSKDEIIKEVNGKLGTKITYIEWRTDEFVVTSINERVILDKKKNPLFDYSGEDNKNIDDKGKETIKNTKYNVFYKPKKPYIRFSVYNIGENIIDDTTCLELSKSLQDEINERKRQIADNSDKAGNPIRTYKGMTIDQSEDADSNLGAGDGVNLGDDQEISYIQAVPLPAFIQNDLQDSRDSIDNIFGIHSATRGERTGTDSGIARESLREGDEDRQATIGRAVEQVSEELYNAFAHLIKVFYDKEELVPFLGKEGSEEMLEYKRDDIADGIRIIVKPGSTIPTDPNALRAQALELLSAEKITTRRAYEMMGIEDADEAVKELELEQVKAQQEQQKILQEEQKQQANEGVKAGFEEQIASIGAGQPQ